MRWQILILTQPSREAMLAQLSSLLVPQITALGLRKFEDVDVLIHTYNRALSLGENRDLMRQRSSGDYINFVDDDDLVSPDYVSRILPLLDGVDQIGFELAYYENQSGPYTTIHSLHCEGWSTVLNPPHYKRDISHLNPMRRDLAIQAPMEGGFGEDKRWADRMRGKVKSEHYIHDIMYYYLHRDRKNDLRDATEPWRLEMIESLKTVRTK